MAAFVPTKPVSGQPVATAWGADVHNRIYTPLACVVTGNVMTGITGAERIASIDTFTNGYNMLDSANDVLVIPAGGSGLFIANAAMRVVNQAQALGNYMRARFTVNGSPSLEGCVMYGVGSNSSWATMTWIGTIGDGGTIGISVIPHATIPGDFTVLRFSLDRIGNSFGTAPALLGPDGKELLPAPERPTPRRKR